MCTLKCTHLTKVVSSLYINWISDRIQWKMCLNQAFRTIKETLTHTHTTQPFLPEEKKNPTEKKAFQAMSNSHHFKVNHVYDVRVYECMKNYLTNRGISIIWQSNRTDPILILWQWWQRRCQTIIHICCILLLSFTGAHTLTHSLTLQRFRLDSLAV